MKEPLLRESRKNEVLHGTLDSGAAVAADMQIHRGGLDGAVTQPVSDGVEVFACFQHMSGEAVPQGMNTATMCDPCPVAGLIVDQPGRMGGDVVIGILTTEEPKVTRPVGSVVGFEFCELYRSEFSIAIFATLSLFNADLHTIAEDIRGLELDDW